MSKASIIAFADTVLQHFPPFRWDEEQEKAWAATMVRELGAFSSDVVERASREIVRTRKKTQTPLVSECIEACLDARKWIDGEKRSSTLPVDGLGPVRNLDWTADRLKLASDLVIGPLGKQAARDGWIGALHAFARKNSRLPQPGKEIEGCKSDAKGFDDAYALVVRGAAGPCSAALERLGALMLKRREILTDRVLHGVVQ